MRLNDHDRISDLKASLHMKYDGFISYATAADAELAPKIQDALEGLAKPWTKRRALKVFRDAADLPATSNLGEQLRTTLKDTQTLILLASEESAASVWCDEELNYWLASRPANELVVALTGGTLEFDATATPPIDFTKSTAAPPALAQLQGIPLYIDLRYDDATIAELDYRKDADFRRRLTQIAAAVHSNSTGTDITPRDIDSLDMRAHQKARRARRIAIVSLTILTVAAAILALLANQQRNEATAQRTIAVQNEQEAITQRSIAEENEHEANTQRTIAEENEQEAITQRTIAEDNARESNARAVAAVAMGVMVDEPDRGALLALESLRVDTTSESLGALLSSVSMPTRFIARTAAHDRVAAIAFHPEAQLAATAGSNGTVTLWEIAGSGEGTPSARWHYETDEIQPTAIRFSSDTDGVETIVVVSHTALTSLSLEAGEQIGQVMLPTGGFAHPSLTGGPTVIIDELGVMIWTADLLERELAIREYTPTPRFAHTVSPAGDVVMWAEDGTLRVWQWQSQTQAVEASFPSRVQSLAVSSDNDTAAMGLASGDILVFSLRQFIASGSFESSNLRHVEFGSFSSADQLAFGVDPAKPNIQILGSGHSNGDVNLWAVGDRSMSLAESLQAHNEAVEALAFGSDGTLASGSFDGEVVWWSGQAIDVLGTTRFVGADHDAANPTYVVETSTETWSMGLDGRVWVSTASGSELFDDSIWSLLDGATDRMTLIGGPSEVFMMDFARPNDLIQVSLPPDDPLWFADTSDDGLVAVVAASGHTTIIDASGAIVVDFPQPDLFVTPPTNVLVDDATAAVWLAGQADTGAVIVSVGLSDGQVRTRYETDANPADWMLTLALSDDSNTLIGGSMDRKLYLWSVGSGVQLSAPLVGHRDASTDVLFVNGDQWVIAADVDGGVFVWDLAQGVILSELHGPRDQVHQLSLAPDGSTLTATSQDGNIYQWSLDPATWISRACAAAGRNMTVAEWARVSASNGEAGSYVKHCPRHGAPDEVDAPVDADYAIDFD